jgi:hypothetical protein
MLSIYPRIAPASMSIRLCWSGVSGARLALDDMKMTIDGQKPGDLNREVLKTASC